jgi:hypothetical protein
MGIEIKRVALDFEWPLSKVWEGFINPNYEGHCKDCVSCVGSGLSSYAKRLQDIWYGNLPFDPGINGSEPFTETHPIIRKKAERNCSGTPDYYGSGERAVVREAVRLAELFNRSWSHHLDRQDVSALLKGGRLMDFTHIPRTPGQVEIVKQKIATGGNSWLPKSNGYVPTPKEVNEWSISGFGHDGINCWIVVKAKCKRLGLPYQCDACKGHGSIWDSPASQKIAENWSRSEHEPPKGEGWQVWETVSEGSPVTPVFPTAEALINHLAEHGDARDQNRGNPGWGREAATAFVGVGWAPSGVSKDGKFYESKDVALALGSDASH